MRTIASGTGFSRLALIALIATAAACTTETIVRQGAPAGEPADGGAQPTERVGDPLVAGLAISEVAFFQGVKVPVVMAGKAVAKAKRNAPVVVGRQALVRVYVTPSKEYTPTAVTAELRLVDGTKTHPVLKDTKTLRAESSDEETDSTFNFEVPAASLTAGVTYDVRLKAAGGAIPAGPSDARFPKDGTTQSLETESSGKLKLVLVPVVYEADQSRRTPDLSGEQLALYKNTFMARYPATEVEVTTHAPLSFPDAITPNGEGFSRALDAVTKLRQTDRAASDVYYYGAFAPAASFRSFCNRGCVLGLSTVVDSPNTAFLRASVGVGFAGVESANTAAHEVGHAHGRSHAPCGGARDTDPDFPYSGGSIGVWGYDILEKTLFSPTRGKDMMGYCPNEWVSDYTFAALFDRIASLNGGTPAARSTSLTGGGSSQASITQRTFRTATVTGDGVATWGTEVELDDEPDAADTRVATFVSAKGETIGTDSARFYPYDHLPGGVLVVPSAPKTTASAQMQKTWSQVRIGGIARAIAR